MALTNLIESSLLFLITVLPLILVVSAATLFERILIATVQRRSGPGIAFYGILQPIADALKALLKELIFPKRADLVPFLLGPILTFAFSLLGWFLIPYSYDSLFLDYDLSFLFFLVISALGFYGILLASYASNSKYAMLGAFRGIAQVISYEIFLSLTILPIIALTGSWNFIDLVFYQSFVWHAFTFWPLAIIFFIALLAETNRIPFDLPEAEAEIVAGYNIEYSGFIFAMFFLGEYANILLNAFIISLLFFGGWNPYPEALLLLIPLPFPPSFALSGLFYNITFIIKALLFMFLWIFVRACLPRYRYDQLMDLGWKTLLPLTLCFFYLMINWGLLIGLFPFLGQIPVTQLIN